MPGSGFEAAPAMMKALLLIVVLGAVWYLWKTITEQKAGAEAKDAAEPDPTAPTPEQAAETAECPVCRAYVPVNAEGGCGREDCPIPELAAALAEETAEQDAPAEPADQSAPPADPAERAARPADRP